MSHRKFNAPRHKSLGFLPRGRSRTIRGRVRAWPKDNQAEKCHITGFIGFKAGMTHIVRDVVRPTSRLHKKEALEPVTIIETPPMMCVGVIGYKETPAGLKPVTTVWTKFVSPEMKRSFYKNWYKSENKKAFASVANADEEKMQKKLAQLKEEACVIRIIAHTQMSKVRLGQRKAQLMEIQVNGGDVAAKVDFAVSLFEKEIPVDTVFAEGEQIDAISVTKGKGFENVIHRNGCKRLQKKTHRGRRKVACIGPWNPKRVSWAVARAGQEGYHHRTEMNKRIYRIGAAEAEGAESATGSTKFDLSKKAITPMGGFPHYGQIKNQFLMIKGSIGGTIKRPITLRKTLNINTRRIATEDINLKWIDTSSKFGHGRFQTKEERNKFLGKIKVARKNE